MSGREGALQRESPQRASGRPTELQRSPQRGTRGSLVGETEGCGGHRVEAHRGNIDDCVKRGSSRKFSSQRAALSRDKTGDSERPGDRGSGRVYGQPVSR